MKKPIPVTVISGYLGAGKTTLLKNILTQEHDKKLAVIVNDMAEINIDNRLIKNQMQLTQTNETVVEMSNGCICCTLREDLLKEVQRLCTTGEYDGIVIENTGVGEPVPVAQTFSYVDEETGIDLSQYAYIDTMVTVVDASTLLDYYFSDKNLQDHKLAISEEDERTVTQLLVEQIEFCNVCIVNKRSMIDELTQKNVVGVIRSLQADAKLLYTDHSDVSISDIIDTQLFDFDTASCSAGWIKELEHDHIPETEEYGISSFTFEQQRPFHPKRFWDLLNNGIHGMIRGKGFARLASRPDAGLERSFAGITNNLGYGGRWLVSFTEDEITALDNKETKQSWMQLQKTPYGDRTTQLVFIGIDMDKEKIINDLTQCLVRNYEMSKSFLVFDDPFEPHMKMTETVDV